MMRPILHGDVTSVARVLLTAPSSERARLCGRIIREAEWADAWRTRTGRMHPCWGNGSLMAAARTRKLADEPTLGDAEYCSCLELVFGQIAAWRAERRSA